jgi:uncharacterized protein (UPF0332 family)
VQATDFLLAAEDLLDTGQGAPRQANLRKACSAVYYALFHTLCETCANTLVRDQTTQRAWTQMYRALEHGDAKKNCKRSEVIGRFPAEMQNFADRFVQMQEKRHRADYDPNPRFYKSEIATDIEAARVAIEDFRDVAVRHRRAFATYMILGNPRP